MAMFINIHNLLYFYYAFLVSCLISGTVPSGGASVTKNSLNDLQRIDRIVKIRSKSILQTVTMTLNVKQTIALEALYI